MPSAAAALGVAGFDDALALGPARSVVVLLVDGLGDVPLARAVARDDVRAPALAAALGPVIDAPFPSTTPVGLAALGTGLSTGCHGMVGAAFRLPETGHALWPLSWKAEPHPLMVQPEPTVLERAAQAGVSVTSVSPRAFEESGLTRAALRGGRYRGADSYGERVTEVGRALAAPGPSLVYAYWGDLDKTGHVHGVDSEAWRAELELVDLLVARIVERLPPDSVLVVTADHGMLDTSDADRVEIEDDPALRHGVAMLAGEPRMRHVYARPGAASDVEDAWAGRLGDRALVMSRERAVDEGWFGEVAPGIEERVGDVIAVATGTTVLSSRTVDPRSSGLKGQHGAVTADETRIPLLVWRR